MGKTLKAKNIASISQVNFIEKEGELVDVVVTCEVNYDTLGLTQQVSLWNKLKDIDKLATKSLWRIVKEAVNSEVIGDDNV